MKLFRRIGKAAELAVAKVYQQRILHLAWLIFLFVASFYRIATERRIVEWLRTDAALTEQSAIKINANTTGNPRKIAAEWDMLVRLKARSLPPPSKQERTAMTDKEPPADMVDAACKAFCANYWLNNLRASATSEQG